MSRLLPMVFVLAATLLAGCSSTPAGGARPEMSPADDMSFDDLDLKASSTTGVVRGVVVDAAIVPIVGAAVELSPSGLSTATDAQGRFGFSTVPAGTYFIAGSKQGYGDIQTSVVVVAGVQDPKPIMLQLDILVGMEPYIQQLKWEGFMECSATVLVAFMTGCMLSDYTTDDSRRFDPVSPTPTFLQSELDWEATQVLGENLCMRHYGQIEEGSSDFDNMGDICGASPLTQMYEFDLLNATGVGVDRGIERVVWVDDFTGDSTAGVALNQDFSVYTHLFYNFRPTDGWTFVAQGEHPLPP